MEIIGNKVSDATIVDREPRAFIYVNDTKWFYFMDWRDHRPPTSKKMRCCRVYGGGLPPKSPIERGKKVHLLMGMKPMSQWGSRSRERPLQAILGGGFPLPATPKQPTKDEKGGS